MTRLAPSVSILDNGGFNFRRETLQESIFGRMLSPYERLAAEMLLLAVHDARKAAYQGLVFKDMTVNRAAWPKDEFGRLQTRRNSIDPVSVQSALDFVTGKSELARLILEHFKIRKRITYADLEN